MVLYVTVYSVFILLTPVLYPARVEQTAQLPQHLRCDLQGGQAAGIALAAQGSLSGGVNCDAAFVDELRGWICIDICDHRDQNTDRYS